VGVLEVPHAASELVLSLFVVFWGIRFLGFVVWVALEEFGPVEIEISVSEQPNTAVV